MKALLALLLVAGAAHAAPVARLPHTFAPPAVRAQLAVKELAIAGHVEIDGEVTGDRVWLHAHGLAVTAAMVNGHALTIDAHDDMLSLAGAPRGKATIAVDYTGVVHEYEGTRPNTPQLDVMTHGVFRRIVDGRSYYFTQGEPTGAREIFPCLDEPGFKVPWTLTLDIPAEGIALANALLVKETRLDAYRLREEFAPTAPLPSYLIAFAIGPFDVVDLGHSIRVAAPRGIKVADPEAHLAISRLEDYLGVPFPYPKLDLVAVPHLGLGAMENAGLITFNPAVEDLAPMIAHEIAHQWFGDLVTFAWWDDVWLAESFAVAVPVFARGDALNYDVKRQMRPVQTQITTEDLASWEPDYGHPMLAIAERAVGREVFRRALGRYLREHANGTTTTKDLWQAFAAESNTVMGAALERVSKSYSWPRYELAASCKAIAIESPNWWALPVCFSYGDAHHRVDRCVTISKSHTQLPVEGCPTWVIASPGPYDATARLGALTTDGWSWLTDAERIKAYEATLDPLEQLQLMAKLPHDPETLRRIAPRLRSYLRYAPTALRPQVDAWVLRVFAAVAASVDLEHLVTDTDHALASLLGQAGDPRLIKQARALVAKSPAPHDSVVDEIAADQDGAYAQQLLMLDHAVLASRYQQLLSALELSRNTRDLVLANPRLLDHVGHEWRVRIMASHCDPAHRGAIVALFDHEDLPEISRRCDERTQVQDRFEPSMRALIAR